MLSPAGSSEESHDVESLLSLRLDSFDLLVETQGRVECYSQDLWVGIKRKGRAIQVHNGTSSCLLSL